MNSKAIVESGSNYVKFGNGLLIQWGFYYKESDSNNIYLTFHQPFSSQSSYTFMINRRSSENATNIVNIWSADTHTATSIRVKRSANTGIYWLAIGY